MADAGGEARCAGVCGVQVRTRRCVQRRRYAQEVRICRCAAPQTVCVCTRASVQRARGRPVPACSRSQKRAPYHTPHYGCAEFPKLLCQRPPSSNRRRLPAPWLPRLAMKQALGAGAPPPPCPASFLCGRRGARPWRRMRRAVCTERRREGVYTTQRERRVCFAQLSKCKEVGTGLLCMCMCMYPLVRRDTDRGADGAPGLGAISPAHPLAGVASSFWLAVVGARDPRPPARHCSLIGRPNADILHHGPPPAYAHGRRGRARGRTQCGRLKKRHNRPDQHGLFRLFPPVAHQTSRVWSESQSAWCSSLPLLHR